MPPISCYEVKVALNWIVNATGGSAHFATASADASPERVSTRFCIPKGRKFQSIDRRCCGLSAGLCSAVCCHSCYYEILAANVRQTLTFGFRPLWELGSAVFLHKKIDYKIF